ncbi:MAG: response regulator [Planctomycetia bacterium]|nr:response regulator [Planctomycetia bacterium]
MPAIPGAILVLYESDTVRRTLRGCLVPEGLDVIEASSLREVDDAADRGGISLLVLDVQRPTTDGVALAADLRLRPGFETIPIVLLTPDWRARDRGFAAAAGVTTCLVKPVAPAVVKQAVLELLGMA